MKVALEVWSSDATQVLTTARTAERLGFDGLYYGESPTGLNLECWTMLAALARETERIRIGPVITNILGPYRSLPLLARHAATVAILSDGRLDFRTGAGASASFGRAWWEPFGVRYGPYDQRLSEMSAALEVLPSFWRNEPVRFEGGDEVTLGADCPAIPITVAATSPRAMRVAATWSDVWETSFCTPSEFAARNGEFPALSPDRVSPVRSLEVDGFVATTRSRHETVLESVRVDRAAAREDLHPVLERALSGPPGHVAGQLRELAAADVEQVVVALHDPHDRDALEALAEARAEVTAR